MLRHSVATISGTAADHERGSGDCPSTSPLRRLSSLRARLIGLLAAILLPWLGLLLYTQADERKAATANVNDTALRLIRIATSNQAAQIEAARQVFPAFSQLPALRTAESSACNAFLAQMLSAYP